MWDYLFDPNPNNPPSNKESPLQAQLSSHWKIKCSIEIQLFTAWEPHALCEVPTAVSHSSIQPLCEVPTAVGHSSTQRNRRAPITRSTTAKFLESPTFSFTGAYCAFLRQWDVHAHCTFAPLGGSTSSNITHTHD